MRQNLLETYGRQIKVAEAYIAKNYEGKVVSDNAKLTTAVLLDNTNRYMTESVTIGGTDRADLGEWKKFCLNLTNIAVPSLIANDLVIVHPMTSFSGSVAYLEYIATATKGNVKKGDMFNSVFAHGEMTEARMNYTSQLIVENVKSGEKLGLTPAVCGKFEVEGVKYDAKVVLADGTVQYKQAADISAPFAADAKVYYFSTEFQMETTPATEIPSIGPRMKRIALVAEPRRIAVKYDQITAFQA